MLDARVILRPEFDRGYPLPCSRGADEPGFESLHDRYGGLRGEYRGGKHGVDQRIAEIQAIAKLREVSRSESYKQALQRAAKKPPRAGAKSHRASCGNGGEMGKGLWKSVNSIGQSVKEVGQGRKQSKYEDSTMEDIIGFSKAKRGIALSLGVDPYSTNPELQKELKSIAWAAYAGQMTLTGALMPVGGPVGLTLKSVNTGSQTYAALRDLSLRTCVCAT